VTTLSKERHRWTDKDFTRARGLVFALVVALVLRKSMKSLQNVVNEAMLWLERSSVSASAYSQARYKLRHTAFIELNRKAVVGTMYRDGDYQTFWGFRVLAVDGSKVALPDSESVREDFGTLPWTGGKNSELQGERPYALASVLYDVLNRVALDATLSQADAYEVDLAVGYLAHTRPGDLLLMDRNFPSYRMLAEMTVRGRDFAVRCSAALATTSARCFSAAAVTSACWRCFSATTARRSSSAAVITACFSASRAWARRPAAADLKKSATSRVTLFFSHSL
jgi:hypothetical protein